MMNTLAITLSIVSDHNHPQDLTASLNSTPSLALVKGEPMRNGENATRHCWHLDFGVSGEPVFDALIKKAVDYVGERSEVLKEVAREPGSMVYLCLVFRNSRFHTGQWLSAQDIATLASASVGLDINLYSVEEEKQVAGSP